MNRPSVLFAHERPSIRHAIERVLEIEGFAVSLAENGAKVRVLLDSLPWDGLVIDVGIPGVPGYELIEHAKRRPRPPVVVLVASIYRKTSYKRRPSRLYGADDYVEIHHLCDQLPEKLRGLLGLEPEQVSAGESQTALRVLQQEGDTRLGLHGDERLAHLIVSDMILYNGDRILAAATVEDAERAVADDLDIARDLYAQVRRAERLRPDPGDPVGDAFRDLMRAMRHSEEGVP